MNRRRAHFVEGNLINLGRVKESQRSCLGPWFRMLIFIRMRLWEVGVGRGSSQLCALYEQFFFLTPKKASWNLCHSGPSNHSHNPAENSAVGAPSSARRFCVSASAYMGDQAQ